ncbi:MAG TPA: hypothetical protein VF593_01620 [Chthoniobacteraceae bacterium]|jgi:hypothetical protein
MKPLGIYVALACLFTSSAFAQTPVTLTTILGKVYKDVVITKLEPDGLTVENSAGVEKVRFVDLPPEIRKQFNFDPAQAAAYTKELADRQTAVRQLVAKEHAIDEAREERKRTMLQPALTLTPAPPLPVPPPLVPPTPESKTARPATLSALAEEEGELVLPEPANATPEPAPPVTAASAASEPAAGKKPDSPTSRLGPLGTNSNLTGRERLMEKGAAPLRSAELETSRRKE